MLDLLKWPFHAAFNCVTSLLYLILVVWAVIDILKNRMPAVNKLVWLLLILFVPYLGVILYVLIGRKMGRGW